MNSTWSLPPLFVADYPEAGKTLVTQSTELMTPFDGNTRQRCGKPI